LFHLLWNAKRTSSNYLFYFSTITYLGKTSLSIICSASSPVEIIFQRSPWLLSVYGSVQNKLYQISKSFMTNWKPSIEHLFSFNTLKPLSASNCLRSLGLIYKVSFLIVKKISPYQNLKLQHRKD
jgi:hypothetical protein